MKRLSVVLLLLASLSRPTVGQDTLMIGRSDALKKLEAGNYQLKISQESVQSARADYRSSNALFLPSVAVSHTAMMTTNPLMAFGSKLNQEILTAADFNPALLNDPEATRNYATRIEVKQPLLNIDGLYGRAAAKAQVEAYGLQSKRTQEYLELEVTKAYEQLQLAYKAVDVLAEAVKTAHENKQLAENFKTQGYLQQADYLSVQMHVGEIENQYAAAVSNVQNASDYLAFLMGEELKGKVYRPSDVPDTTLTPATDQVQLNEGRADMQAMALSTSAYKRMMQKERGSLLPRLNAFGSYEMHDNEIFGTTAQGYLVGAQLSWDLFDGYSSIGKYEKAKVEYHKASDGYEQYKAQSNLELNKTVRQLKDAENTVLLARLSTEQAREAFRIRQNRFRQGLEKATDLLLSETMLSQKELELQQAYFQYHVTQSYLHFLTR